MFAEFKLIAETAVAAYKALAGKQRAEWKQIGGLFEKISDALKSMAEKYGSGLVPTEEFIEIQVYATELQNCWQNLPLSGKGKEVRRWAALLDSAITTANGTDAAYFGFRSVPGPFFSTKEGPVPRRDPDAAMPPPTAKELREAAAAFRAAATIFKGRGA